MCDQNYSFTVLIKSKCEEEKAPIQPYGCDVRATAFHFTEKKSQKFYGDKGKTNDRRFLFWPLFHMAFGWEGEQR